MKPLRKSNAGFTLMELVVTIAIASIVTVAATSVLMLALRVNRQASDTASQQKTVRALLSTMEDAAADGNIKSLVSNFDSWQLVGESESEETPPTAIFEYDSDEQTIYAHGVSVLEGVYASHAVLDGDLLTISVETAEGTYTSSIWCRLGMGADGDNVVEEGTPSVPDQDDTTLTGTVSDFLDVLKLQYDSRGEIIYSEEKPKLENDPTYYSEWYIGGYGNNPAWTSETPWCACFVSWALDQAGVAAPADHPRWYAEVDNFMAYFDGNGWHDSYAVLEQQGMGAEAYKPVAGDLIFFDWDADGDPQHIGVVLSLFKHEDGSYTIYTIEGNSAGRVAIRSYAIDDDRILGYGILFENA